jgi:hypothetical protein
VHGDLVVAGTGHGDAERAARREAALERDRHRRRLKGVRVGQVEVVGVSLAVARGFFDLGRGGVDAVAAFVESGHAVDLRTGLGLPVGEPGTAELSAPVEDPDAVAAQRVELGEDLLPGGGVVELAVAGFPGLEVDGAAGAVEGSSLGRGVAVRAEQLAADRFLDVVPRLNSCHQLSLASS